MEVAATRWRGFNALEYSASGVTVTMVPDRGAKITSLRDQSDAEWLLQGDPGGRPTRRVANFIDAEMCGWDECAPSIEPTPLGISGAVPDHGDVWDSPWFAQSPTDYRASMPSIGAMLRRAIEVADDGTVSLRYSAWHDGLGPVPMLWAAHPQFLSYEGDRLEVDGVASWWDVSSCWPTRVPDSLTAAPFNQRPAPHESAKYYADPASRPRTARLVRRSGQAMTIAWTENVPYLGVWVDRSRFAAHDVIAIEPSTGWYDSLARAVELNRVAVLQPGETFDWSMSVRFDA